MALESRAWRPRNSSIRVLLEKRLVRIADSVEQQRLDDLVAFARAVRDRLARA